MNAATLVGRLIDRGGTATRHDRYGRLDEAISYNVAEITIDDGAVVDVDVEHDGRRAGEVIWAERNADGDVNGVAVVDVDRIDGLDLDEPLFFSPTLFTDWTRSGVVSTGRRPVLTSVALTRSPAQLGMMRPLRVWQGDARRTFDRSWMASWRGDGVLRRAVEHGTDRSLRIVDLDEWGRPALDDLPVVHRRHPSTYSGGMAHYHSAPIGRILTVGGRPVGSNR